MSSVELRAGRWIAAALVAQMILGPVTNFVLLRPLTLSPGFLVNAAAHPRDLSLAIVLGLTMAALNLAIAIVAWPVLRRRGERAALSLFAIGVACFVLMTAEYTGWLTMGELSRQHAAGDTSVAALFDAVSTARVSAHYFGLMTSCALAFTFHAACWMHALLPRWLAGAGMLSSALAVAAALHPVFGMPVALDLMMPLGLCELVLAVWLAWKGFRVAA